MGEAQEPLAQWFVHVKEIINHNRSPENEGRVLRVAPPLLKEKPEVYVPQYVSMGPYYHWKLQKEIPASPSTGVNYEEYKLRSVFTFLRKKGLNLDDKVEKIRGKLEEIEKFYNWQISRDGEYPDHFAFMVAIDLSFLFFFLCNSYYDILGEVRSLTRFDEVSIECDILKLENQISLSLLRILFEDESSFNRTLERTCRRMSPFFSLYGTLPDMDKQPHLLGLLHRYVLPGLGLLGMEEIGQGNKEILRENPEYNSLFGWNSEGTLTERAQYYLENVVAKLFTLLHVGNPTNIEDRRDILNSYNAEQLEKGGIQFKRFIYWEHSKGIRFNKYSASLYLPCITVFEMQTEVFFKNMLALELNDAARGFSVTRYVGLMSHLMGTPEDVRVLRNSEVIYRLSRALTDEKIARMWNDMCHPIFTGHVEPPMDLSAAIEEALIRKYYWGIIKWVLWGFYWVPIKERLSKPGKGIALLVGILILVMTVIQTYCSLVTFLRTY